MPGQSAARSSASGKTKVGIGPERSYPTGAMLADRTYSDKRSYYIIFSNCRQSKLTGSPEAFIPTGTSAQRGQHKVR